MVQGVRIGGVTIGGGEVNGDAELELQTTKDKVEEGIGGCHPA